VARPKQRPRVNRYSIEFKLQAVKFTEMDGVQVKDVAEALDIHPYMLSKWRSDVRKGLIPPPPHKSTIAGRRRQAVATTQLKRERAARQRDVTRLAELKREHALLKREHELLKKAIRFTSARKPRSSRSSSRKRTASA
jgi:transposase